MSITVSQRNRAVSQAAVEAIATARRFTYKNLFAMPGGHNTLNGAFHPFGTSTDCGWWGSELSDSNGYLPNPAVLTIIERASAYIYSIRGIQNNYPVDFTLTLYLRNTVQKRIEVKDNRQSSLDITLDQAYDVDKIELSITRISVPNDVLKIATASFGLNLSSLMKLTERRIRGRVEVTYANAIKDAEIRVSEGAHGSSGANLNNEVLLNTRNLFKLYDNRLDGTYFPAGDTTETGWWPKGMPDAAGQYESGTVLVMSFSKRNLYGFHIAFDTLDYLKAGSIQFVSSSGDVQQLDIVDCDATLCVATLGVVTLGAHTVSSNAVLASNDIRTSNVYKNIVEVRVIFGRSSRPNRPAILTEVAIVSSIVYDDTSLIDVSLLEELSYEDSLEKLGGVSANELTVNFSNADKSFYFNNPNSVVANGIKKNRRVRAWLGIDVPNSDTTIWSTLGTFWTYSWDVPVGSPVAKMIAFDTIGFLGTQTYRDHFVYRDKSIGELVDIVLTSAKKQFKFITWRVDPELYDIIIPIAWFAYGSYAAALNRIASCEMMHIYCARDGSIVASKRFSGVQSPDDVWSDATNVIDKTYPTLYTAQPNYIDVHMTNVATSDSEVLNVADVNYTVSAGEVRILNFSSPVESVSSVVVDTTASYTYEWFSWGIIITFTTSGVLTGVSVNGSMLELTDASYIQLQDAESIEENGIISCDIKSDFIQTTEHASRLAQYLHSKVPDSIYDVEVQYRGDIALTLNSKISLPEGIAPNTLYFIKRHELNWNGSLSGTARLNT